MRDKARGKTVRDQMVGHLYSRTREELEDIIEFAWGVIANAGRGDWTSESAEWQEAAHKWGVWSGFRHENPPIYEGEAHLRAYRLQTVGKDWTPGVEPWQHEFFPQGAADICIACGHPQAAHPEGKE